MGMPLFPQLMGMGGPNQQPQQQGITGLLAGMGQPNPAAQTGMGLLSAGAPRMLPGGGPQPMMGGGGPRPPMQLPAAQIPAGVPSFAGAMQGNPQLANILQQLQQRMGAQGQQSPLTNNPMLAAAILHGGLGLPGY